MTTYKYPGKPAWDHDVTELVQSTERTWSQWRGCSSRRCDRFDQVEQLPLRFVPSTRTLSIERRLVSTFTAAIDASRYCRLCLSSDLDEARNVCICRQHPGLRQIIDTLYDSRGLIAKRTHPYFNGASGPSTSLFVPAQPTDVPADDTYSYDGDERPLTDVFNVHGQEQWRTTTNRARLRRSRKPDFLAR